MQTTTELQFLLNLSKTYSIIVKRFDAGLGNGISFHEFLILHYVTQSENGALRRVDLANKMELTASGITRLLLPMEKIGLVYSPEDSQDARVKLVSVSDGGLEKYQDALERIQVLLKETCSRHKSSDIQKCLDLLTDVGGKIVMQ